MPSHLSRLRNKLRPADPGLGRAWRRVVAADGAQWEQARAEASGPRVLVATSLGGYTQGTGLESTLTAALTLRGAVVDVLLCDEFLPACQLTKLAKIRPEEFVTQGQRNLCRPCFRAGRAAYDPLGVDVLRFSDQVDEQDRALAAELSRSVPTDEVVDWRWEGLAVGEHAFAGALRYYGRGDLHGEEQGPEVVRRYLEAALLTVFSMRSLLRERHYDVAVFHHGIYVPQGLIGEVCRAEGVRVVNSNPAYRDKTFVFSHGDSYHHTMISENPEVWRSLPWDERLEAATMDYLHKRRHGSDDWIHFNLEPEESLERISAETGLRFDKPTVALLTNVLWDAQLHYASNAFPGMLDWVLHTIRWFGDHPELHLVIRVHPAEVSGAVPSRQPLVPEIVQAFPALPDNVTVVGPESKVSTYSLAEQCDAALIYNTKTGIELASVGIPVVVAGEAWIRGKGFSLDASSVEEYDAVLQTLPRGERLTGAQLTDARKYAFHFFFRRMVPLPFMSSPRRFELSLDLEDLSPLLPGATAGLDVVCDGILHGSPFVYRAEDVVAEEAAAGAATQRETA